MYWPKKYMRMRFKDKGRDVSGVDCWGLVCLVFKNELGITLPDYGETSVDDLRRVSAEMERNSNDENWLEVETPKEFDVAIMRFYGHRTTGHVGLITPDGKLLHIESETNVSLVPLSHPMVKNRLKGFRRFRQNDQGSLSSPVHARRS